MRYDIKRRFEDIPVFQHFTRQKPSVQAFRKSVPASIPVEMSELQHAGNQSLEFFDKVVRHTIADEISRDMFEDAILQSHKVLVQARKHDLVDLATVASELYEHLRDRLDFTNVAAPTSQTISAIENYTRLLRGVINPSADDIAAVPDDLDKRRRKILIVDDDEIAREIVKTSLVGMDCEIEEAESGFVALEALENSQPDLIILDVGLPGLNGFSVLKLIKDWPEKAEIPVILLTGKDGIDDYVVGLSRGAVDYIVKPVALPELKKRVLDVMTHNCLRQNSK